MSSVRSQDQIEARERDLLDRVPVDAQHVPNTQTHDFDARLNAAFVGTQDVPIAGRVRIEAGTALELKTCQVWISDNGSGNGRRRGTFQINRETHERLVDLGGVYLLLVMDGEDILAGVIIEAHDLEAFVTSWTNAGTTMGSTASHEGAQISWASVIPTERVKGGGVRPMTEVADEPR